MINKLKLLKKYLFSEMPLKYNFKNYDEYWIKRGFISPAITRANLISPRISKNKRILDIGCGDGSLMKVLVKKNSPSFIYGIDISAKAIKHTRYKNLKGKVINIQTKNFKKFLSSNKFDYIILTEVIEHIQNPEDILLLIKQTQPNAKIFVSIPNSGFILHRLRLLLGKFPVVTINIHVKEHIRFWTHSDFKYWSNFLGFKIKNVIVSSTSKILGIDLGKLLPSLFAIQIIYELKRK